MSRAELARFRLQNIGIFPEFQFVSALTAAENIELVLNVKGMRRRAAREWLEQVGLGHQANQKPGDLSGGQKQRVAIADALAIRG